jgi:hypothetical protein
MHRTAMIALLILQAFVAAFVLLHDWLPLGRLNNDNRGVREVDPLAKRIRVTLFSALPFVIGLAWSIAVVHRPRLPMGLDIFLCITYLVALYGLLRAWWIPYLWIPDPARAERYRIMFAGTHRFLPERNGIAPDTLHVTLHLCVLGILILLALA